MRFKKLLLIPALLGLGLGGLTGCGNKQGPAEFTIWTFSSEMGKLVRKYYSNHIVDVQNKQKVTAVQDDFEAYLKNGKTLPDVLCLEAAVVADYRQKTYDENPLLPLENLGDLSDMYSYTKDVVTTPDNHIIGLSWQATPGGFFYRSDLAKEKLNINSPEEMETTYLSSWQGYLNLAQKCKEARIMVTSSTTDPIKAFLSERDNPWVVDNVLQMETSMFGGGTEEYNCFDVIRALHQNNYSHQTTERESDYWSDMNGNLVLGYFCSSWGFSYDLMTHATRTSGKWNMCKAPTNYFKGGTWLAVPKNAPHKQAALEFVKYVTTNKTFLEQRCIETGDFMNSSSTMAKLKDTDLSKSEFGIFLGGQTNHIEKLWEVAQSINGNLISPYDAIIDGHFTSACGDFAMVGYTGQGVDPYKDDPTLMENARNNYKANFLVAVNKSYPTVIPPAI